MSAMPLTADDLAATARAAELAKPGADPNAPPPFQLPQQVNEWAGWAPSDALEEAIEHMLPLAESSKWPPRDNPSASRASRDRSRSLNCWIA